LSKLLFSIVIPVKSINDFVRENIAACLSLYYQNWEAYIVTNNLEKSEWDDSRIKLLQSGKVSPAIKRNLAVKHAVGDIILFLDDDSYPVESLLNTYSDTFSNHKIKCAGGPGITPKTDGLIAQISGAFYESALLGGNPHRYKSLQGDKEFDDWPSVNMAIRKSVFEDIGGFKTEFWPGEDTAFCRSLLEAGILTRYVPNAIVFHHRRNSLKNHLKQAGNYGLHRGHFARVFPENSRRLKYFIPTFFTLYLFLLLLTLKILENAILIGVVITPLMAYVFVLIYETLKSLFGGRYVVSIFLAPVSLLTHVTYGLRFMQGLLFTRRLRSKLR
jgi:GT2 family glycosyltransferase